MHRKPIGPASSVASIGRAMPVRSDARIWDSHAMLYASRSVVSSRTMGTYRGADVDSATR